MEVLIVAALCLALGWAIGASKDEAQSNNVIDHPDYVTVKIFDILIDRGVDPKLAPGIVRDIERLLQYDET